MKRMLHKAMWLPLVSLSFLIGFNSFVINAQQRPLKPVMSEGHIINQIETALQQDLAGLTNQETQTWQTTLLPLIEQLIRSNPPLGNGYKNRFTQKLIAWRQGRGVPIPRQAVLVQAPAAVPLIAQRANLIASTVSQQTAQIQQAVGAAAQAGTIPADFANQVNTLAQKIQNDTQRNLELQARITELNAKIKEQQSAIDKLAQVTPKSPAQTNEFTKRTAEQKERVSALESTVTNLDVIEKSLTKNFAELSTILTQAEQPEIQNIASLAEQTIEENKETNDIINKVTNILNQADKATETGIANQLSPEKLQAIITEANNAVQSLIPQLPADFKEAAEYIIPALQRRIERYQQTLEPTKPEEKPEVTEETPVEEIEKPAEPQNLDVIKKQINELSQTISNILEPLSVLGKIDLTDSELEYEELIKAQQDAFDAELIKIVDKIKNIKNKLSVADQKTLETNLIPLNQFEANANTLQQQFNDFTTTFSAFVKLYLEQNELSSDPADQREEKEKLHEEFQLLSPTLDTNLNKLIELSKALNLNQEFFEDLQSKINEMKTEIEEKTKPLSPQEIQKIKAQLKVSQFKGTLEKLIKDFDTLVGKGELEKSTTLALTDIKNKLLEKYPSKLNALKAELTPFFSDPYTLEIVVQENLAALTFDLEKKIAEKIEQINEYLNDPEIIARDFSQDIKTLKTFLDIALPRDEAHFNKLSAQKQQLTQQVAKAPDDQNLKKQLFLTDLDLRNLYALWKTGQIIVPAKVKKEFLRVEGGITQHPESKEEISDPTKVKKFKDSYYVIEDFSQDLEKVPTKQIKSILSVISALFNSYEKYRKDPLINAQMNNYNVLAGLKSLPIEQVNKFIATLDAYFKQKPDIGESKELTNLLNAIEFKIPGAINTAMESLKNPDLNMAQLQTLQADLKQYQLDIGKLRQLATTLTNLSPAIKLKISSANVMENLDNADKTISGTLSEIEAKLASLQPKKEEPSIEPEKLSTAIDELDFENVLTAEDYETALEGFNALPLIKELFNSYVNILFSIEDLEQEFENAKRLQNPDEQKRQIEQILVKLEEAKESVATLQKQKAQILGTLQIPQELKEKLQSKIKELEAKVSDAINWLERRIKEFTSPLALQRSIDLVKKELQKNFNAINETLATAQYSDITTIDGMRKAIVNIKQYFNQKNDEIKNALKSFFTEQINLVEQKLTALEKKFESMQQGEILSQAQTALVGYLTALNETLLPLINIDDVNKSLEALESIIQDYKRQADRLKQPQDLPKKAQEIYNEMKKKIETERQRLESTQQQPEPQPKDETIDQFTKLAETQKEVFKKNFTNLLKNIRQIKSPQTTEFESVTNELNKLIQQAYGFISTMRDFLNQQEQKLTGDQKLKLADTIQDLNDAIQSGSVFVSYLEMLQKLFGNRKQILDQILIALNNAKDAAERVRGEKLIITPEGFAELTKKHFEALKENTKYIEQWNNIDLKPDNEAQKALDRFKNLKPETRTAYTLKDAFANFKGKIEYTADQPYIDIESFKNADTAIDTLLNSAEKLLVSIAQKQQEDILNKFKEKDLNKITTNVNTFINNKYTTLQELHDSYNKLIVEPINNFVVQLENMQKQHPYLEATIKKAIELAKGELDRAYNEFNHKERELASPKEQEQIEKSKWTPEQEAFIKDINDTVASLPLPQNTNEITATAAIEALEPLNVQLIRTTLFDDEDKKIFSDIINRMIENYQNRLTELQQLASQKEAEAPAQ